MINPDDVQSPYGHGQWMLQALVGLWLIWAALYGVALYVQKVNDARKADKARRQR